MTDTSTPPLDVFEAMATTRAMRRLKPDPVPDQLIRRILEAGVCAANGANRQTWRFGVVKDPVVKEAVQRVYQRAFDEVVSPMSVPAWTWPPRTTSGRGCRRRPGRSENSRLGLSHALVGVGDDGQLHGSARTHSQPPLSARSARAGPRLACPDCRLTRVAKKGSRAITPSADQDDR